MLNKGVNLSVLYNHVLERVTYVTCLSTVSTSRGGEGGRGGCEKEATGYVPLWLKALPVLYQREYGRVGSEILVSTPSRFIYFKRVVYSNY